MIAHLVATALTIVGISAADPPERSTGESVTHIGTAVSIVGGQASPELSVGNTLKLVGSTTKGITNR